MQLPVACIRFNVILFFCNVQLTKTQSKAVYGSSLLYSRVSTVYWHKIPKIVDEDVEAASGKHYVARASH